MAQTGFTPLLIYSSSTATNEPTAGNLLNNATGSELAINIADGKLFYKDSSNAVQVIGWKIRPATAGGTGLTSFAIGDLIYADTTTTLAKLADVATGNALISGGVGVAPSYGKIGLTTHVSGTLPIANGGTNSTATATSGGISYGTGTAFAFTSAGTSGQALISAGASAPAFGALAIGTANTNVSGALTVTNGGTGLSTFPVGYIPYGNGTSAFQANSSLQYDGANLNLGNGGTLGFPTNLNLLANGGANSGAFTFKNTAGNNQWLGWMWNNAAGATSFNLFVAFGTDSSYTNRGSITYNSTAGLLSFNTTSDQRLKTNIIDAPSALDKINSIQIRSFDWIETGNHNDFGVIAQELMTVAPEAVTPGDDAKQGQVQRPWSVDTSALNPAMIKAIQELNAKVIALEEQVLNLSVK